MAALGFGAFGAAGLGAAGAAVVAAGLGAAFDFAAALGLAAALGFATLGLAAFFAAGFLAAGFFYTLLIPAGWRRGGSTATGFFSPAGAFFASFNEPEWPAVVVNTPESNPRLIAALNCWGPRQRSRHHHGCLRGKKDEQGSYLTIKVGGSGFIVALDIFLDSLAR